MDMDRELSWVKSHGGSTAKVAGACSKLNEYMNVQRMFLQRDKSRINVRASSKLMLDISINALYCCAAQWEEIVEYLDKHSQLPRHEFWTLLSHGDKCAMIASAKRLATFGGTIVPFMLSTFPGQESVIVLLNGHVQMYYGKTDTVQHTFNAGAVFGQLEAFSPEETIAYRNDVCEVDPGDSLRMKMGQALVIHKADAQRAIRIARYGPDVINEETDPDAWTPDSLAKRHLPEGLYQLLLPKLYQMPREELSQWQIGETLFEAGDHDDQLYVILQGSVELVVPIQPTRCAPAAAPARPESRIPTEPTELTYPSITCSSKLGTVSVRIRTLPVVIAGAGVIVSSTGVVELEGQTSSGERSATGECLMSAIARAPCIVLTISRRAVKLLYRDAPKQLQRKVASSIEAANSWMQQKLQRAMVGASQGHRFAMRSSKKQLEVEGADLEVQADASKPLAEAKDALLFQPPIRATDSLDFLALKPEHIAEYLS